MKILLDNLVMGPETIFIISLTSSSMYDIWKKFWWFLKKASLLHANYLTLVVSHKINYIMWSFKNRLHKTNSLGAKRICIYIYPLFNKIYVFCKDNYIIQFVCRIPLFYWIKHYSRFYWIKLCVKSRVELIKI